MPPKPSGPVSRITSDGKCLFRSQSSAFGATRSAANASAIAWMARWSSLSSNWPAVASTAASMASSLTFLARLGRQSRPMMRPRNRTRCARLLYRRCRWPQFSTNCFPSSGAFSPVSTASRSAAFSAASTGTCRRESSSRTACHASRILAAPPGSPARRQGRSPGFSKRAAATSAGARPIPPPISARNSSTITAGWKCSARAAISPTARSPAAS